MQYAIFMCLTLYNVPLYSQLYVIPDKNKYKQGNVMILKTVF